MTMIKLKPIILLVESDMMIARILMESLKHKYEVHHLQVGFLFYNQIKNHNYDLIICNLIISFYTGLELLSILRYQLLKPIPFILLTISDDIQLLQIPISDTSFYCLIKPYSLEALQTKIQIALSQAKSLY